MKTYLVGKIHLNKQYTRGKEIKLSLSREETKRLSKKLWEVITKKDCGVVIYIPKKQIDKKKIISIRA